jgi:hypothetical protein
MDRSDGTPNRLSVRPAGLSGGIISTGGIQGGMDRQKILAIFFALLMAMWLVATAATLL